jgi:hypothetical protein
MEPQTVVNLIAGTHSYGRRLVLQAVVGRCQRIKDRFTVI